MSLDVYLTSRNSKGEDVEVVYSSKITHNLNRMADAVGIYKPLWRPGEVGITLAVDLIGPLRAGLTQLKTDPDRFKIYDSCNGWGKYRDFVPFVEDYLDACERYPDAGVRATR